jgi:quercetin dioxygenase-like cupin family protein
MSQAVTTSGLDWTIVRFLAPEDGPTEGELRTGFFGTARLELRRHPRRHRRPHRRLGTADKGDRVLPTAFSRGRSGDWHAGPMRGASTSRELLRDAANSGHPPFQEATMTPRPFAVHLDQAPAYWSLGELLTIVASAEQTGGAFSLMEERLPRGAEPPPHIHRREHESFFVLDGALSVRVGEETFAAEAGAFVFCPLGIPHVLTVDSDEVRMLTLCSPGGVEALFVELGEPALARTLPIDAAEPDADRIVTLAAHYGAEVLTDWP